MVSSMSFKIFGLEKANIYLKKSKVLTKKAIANSMNTIGLYMEGEVKDSISGHKGEPSSVDTGNFLNSVYSKSNKDSVIIQDDTSYGKYLEYGTSRLGERRHFRNSLARNKSKIQEFINSSIKRLV